jgi:hypothetical protein
MGVVVRPGEHAVRSKKKGKEVASGHVVFVDAREECESAENS